MTVHAAQLMRVWSAVCSVGSAVATTVESIEPIIIAEATMKKISQ